MSSASDFGIIPDRNMSDPRQDSEPLRCSECGEYATECRQCHEGVLICCCDGFTEAEVIFSIHLRCLGVKAQELQYKVDRYERFLSDLGFSLQRHLGMTVSEQKR